MVGGGGVDVFTYTLTDSDPDYVVLGETRTYSFERITEAIRLIGSGAQLSV